MTTTTLPAEVEQLMTSTPIFVDVLAATAKFGRPDAAAHYVELHDVTDVHLVDTYLEWYGADK